MFGHVSKSIVINHRSVATELNPNPDSRVGVHACMYSCTDGTCAFFFFFLQDVRFALMSHVGGLGAGALPGSDRQVPPSRALRRGEEVCGGGGGGGGARRCGEWSLGF